MGSLKHLKLSESIVGAKSKWQVPQKEKAKEEKLDLKVCGLKSLKIAVINQVGVHFFWINLYANVEMWWTENDVEVPRIILVKYLSGKYGE